MSAAKWVLMVWIVFSAMRAVILIGQPVKPVKPTTPAVALLTLMLLGAMAWMVVLA